ncbi:MAG: hypothetical protein DI538_24410 [Azospira oryzae]|jgi:hypothetical protein|nr:hypothetical protein [Cytophaga sp.]PZR29036.1 MAG: hypothetical protein DI538_24410 [Azospira oryzae]
MYFLHSENNFFIIIVSLGCLQPDTPPPQFLAKSIFINSWRMIEFLEDVVKLFSNVNEEEPLPLSHKIVAVSTCCIVAGLCVVYYYWG